MDLSDPVGTNKRHAISNVPHIIMIVLGNLRHRKGWTKEDLDLIKSKSLRERTKVASDPERGLEIVDHWVREGLSCCAHAEVSEMGFRD